MNGLQLEKALNEVLRDYHKSDDKNAVIIKNIIAAWYYTTLITAEKCIELLVSFCTTGSMDLQGCFN